MEADYKNRLYELLSQKEKYEKSLESLAALRRKGEVGEEHYLMLSEEYEQKLSDVESKIEALKKEIENEVTGLLAEKRELEEQLKILEVRTKVGEIEEDTFLKEKNKLEGEIQELNVKIDELEALASAEKLGDLELKPDEEKMGTLSVEAVKEKAKIELEDAEERTTEPKVEKLVLSPIEVPLGIKLLGILCIIGGGFCLIAAFGFEFPVLAKVFLAGVGLLYFYFAYSLFALKKWARKVLLAVSSVALVLSFISLGLLESPKDIVMSVRGIVYNAIVVAYLTRPHVKRVFEPVKVFAKKGENTIVCPECGTYLDITSETEGVCPKCQTHIEVVFSEVQPSGKLWGLTQEKADAYENVKTWIFGLLLGLGGAMIGGTIFWGIAKATGYLTGLGALASGAITGIAFGLTTTEGDRKLRGLIGAFLGLLSIVFGYYLLYTTPIYGVLKASGFLTFDEFLRATIGPIDYLFFAIGIYEGAKFGSMSKEAATYMLRGKSLSP